MLSFVFCFFERCQKSFCKICSKGNIQKQLLVSSFGTSIFFDTPKKLIQKAFLVWILLIS